MTHKQAVAYDQLRWLGWEYQSVEPLNGDITLARFERGQEYVHLLAEIILHSDGTHTDLTPRPPRTTAPSSTNKP